ncbi:MAG: phospho-N-acetylmuramoyl-pentapeptide-transferase [Oscillospiraceae bacterium]|nr:phospho-N-acetylmuramoyl-pentapeptide-transferase [Oscillospiraceae bacterium]
MQGLIPLFAAVFGFLISLILGYPLIPMLRKLKFGQTIRDIGPAWHKSKEGTPTMGGVIIIAGVVISMVLSFMVSSFTGSGLINESSNSMKMTFLFSGIGLALGMGMIGFLDDYIKVVKKRNLGLTARQKTFLQLFVSAAYLTSLALGGMTTTWFPFIGDINVMHSFGLLFWPIALLFIFGFTNAVNLTDGIDGLASSVTMVVCCGFMLAAGLLDFAGINTLAAATAGACIGFLIWNAHPAKVFMGDTGSLFLGGTVVALAFGIGRPILLIFAGIIYLIEAFSVILQVAYYKRTKKRLFKMSPLHHHFELSDWGEEKIVIVFSFVTLIGCILALLPIVLRW